MAKSGGDNGNIQRRSINPRRKAPTYQIARRDLQEYKLRRQVYIGE